MTAGLELWPLAAEVSAALVRILLREAAFSTVVFGVVFVLCRALGGRRPALRHALWSLVFVRLLLPPDLAHPWSAGALAERLLPDARLLEDARGVQPFGKASAGHPTLAALHAAGAPAAADSPWVLAAALWLAGVTAWSFVYWRRHRAYRAVIRDSRAVTDPAARALASHWRKRLRIRRPVRLLSSAAAVSPFTAGILRPVVFLPRAVLRDEAVLEPVLAHELAHVARWDSLWLGLQNVVQTLYFFHPLVWASGAALARERERLCDAVVLAHGRFPARAYGESLLAVLKLNPRGLEVPHLITHKRRLAMRLSSILAAEKSRPNPKAALAAAFVVGLFLLPLATGDVSAGGEPPPAPTAGAVDPAQQLANPLPGSRISWRFGEGKDPWSGEKVHHRGIDLIADHGTPVRAPADGVVRVATTRYEPSVASGTVVVVDHGDGLETFYGHLGSLNVEEGQRLARHDVLAGVGSTGRSTGPHLHFEVWQGGEPVDPARWVPEWAR